MFCLVQIFATILSKCGDLYWIFFNLSTSNKLCYKPECQQKPAISSEDVFYIHISAHRVWTHLGPVLRSRFTESSGHICWVKPQIWSIDSCKRIGSAKPDDWVNRLLGTSPWLDLHMAVRSSCVVIQGYCPWGYIRHIMAHKMCFC